MLEIARLVGTWVLFCFLGLSQAQARAVFNDQSLEQLLKKSERNQTSGIIWIWSPRMVLSYAAGVKELKPISLLLNLESTYLVDPFVDDTEIAMTHAPRELQNSPAMHSLTLNRFGALLHYPVLFIYKNGKLLLPSRPGYDEPWRLYDYLVRRLQ